jgi:hypothetical protein
MRIAVIATYTHPTRKRVKEASIMQSAVPELIAGLCPPHAEVEIFNEKETDIPLDWHWDLVFFSYLHSYYEHTKVLSTLFRQRGIVTVAGGRHAGYFPDDVAQYFDAVITSDPEPTVSPEEEQAAEDDLWNWYLEWGGIARNVVSDRRLLRNLGFLQSRRSSDDDIADEIDDDDVGETEVAFQAQPQA